MLFDLRGKRRRVVQISYAALAAIFLVGFVGFGIGSEGGVGGIGDLFSGDGSGGSITSQFDEQIDAANQELAKNPQDAAALLRLAKYEYFKGKQGVTTDEETGAPVVSDDARAELAKSVDAWNKYLRANEGKPDSAVASQMVQAFYLLNDAGGAAEAQRIVAEDRPSSGTYGQLAFFLYFAGDISGGDTAAEKALAEASGAERKGLEDQLDQIRAQGVKIKKAEAKAGQQTVPGENPLGSPLGATP
jgi:hypothetical protein